MADYDYSQRKQRSLESEQAVEHYFNANGWQWKPLGYEKLYGPDDISKIIRLSETDPVYWNIRYAPDYKIIHPREMYIEVKSTNTIERRSFEHLLAMANSGKSVRIFWYWKPTRIYSFDPRDIQFCEDDWQPGRGGSQLPCKTINLSSAHIRIDPTTGQTKAVPARH